MKNKLSDVNWMRIIIFILILIIVSIITSCSPKLTPHQTQIDYELDKAYLEYSYTRDSLIIEYYKKQIK